MTETFNTVLSFEDKRWSSNEQKVEFRHRAALNLVPEKVTSVLDLGCGEGTFLQLLRQRSPKLTLIGADLSGEAIKRAREKTPGVAYAQLDETGRLPFGDETVDVVVLLDVLEHTLEPELLLREVARVSKKYVLVSVPNFVSLPARIQVLFGQVPENNKRNKGHMYWFTESVLHKMLTEAGFSVSVQVSNHQLQGTNWASLVGFGNKLFPSLFGLSFVMLAEK